MSPAALGVGSRGGCRAGQAWPASAPLVVLVEELVQLLVVLGCELLDVAALRDLAEELLRRAKGLTLWVVE